MEKGWYWKVAFVVLLVMLSVLYLLPTFLPKSLPTWYTDFFNKKINLGLDLQGGIHLVLGVEVDKALEDKADQYVADFKDALKEKRIEYKKVSRIAGTWDVRFELTDPEDEKKLRKRILDRYYNLEVTEDDEETPGVVRVTFKDEYVEELRRNARDQARITVRNRVDELGVTMPTIAPHGENGILVQLPGMFDPERAKKLLGRTAQLEFKLVDDKSDFIRNLKDELPEGIRMEYYTYTGPDDEPVTEAYLIASGKGNEGKNRLLDFFNEVEEIKAFLEEKEVDPQVAGQIMELASGGISPLEKKRILEMARPHLAPETARLHDGGQPADTEATGDAKPGEKNKDTPAEAASKKADTEKAKAAGSGAKKTDAEKAKAAGSDAKKADAEKAGAAAAGSDESDTEKTKAAGSDAKKADAAKAKAAAAGSDESDTEKAKAAGSDAKKADAEAGSDKADAGKAKADVAGAESAEAEAGTAEAEAGKDGEAAAGTGETDVEAKGEEAGADEAGDEKAGKPVHTSGALAELEKLLDGRVPDDHQIGFGRKESQLEVEYRTYYLHREVAMTGDYITDASVRPDPETGQPEVALNFDRNGADKFEKLTGAHVRERMAIVLEGEVASAPVIQSRIGGGSARITLGATRNYNEALSEANDLAVVLRAGALPAPVRILQERTVGPTMGEDARNQGVTALAIGLILVILAMVIYYRVSGLIADMALVINAVFILAVMAAFQATLTLPGIAGIILTIGMAVDANVIINERVREELHAGKTPRAAVDAGYSHAFSTIFDANFTTMIAAVVLWSYGSGPIQGFAVTLFIGILASMFTAIFVTRLVMDYLTVKRKVERLSI